jgi:hypothetical protein
MPYVVKLLEQELSTYMNIGLRFLTAKNVQVLRKPPIKEIQDELLDEYLKEELPETVILSNNNDGEYKAPEAVTISASDLAALGEAQAREGQVPLEKNENEALEETFEQNNNTNLEIASLPSVNNQEGGFVQQQQQQQQQQPVNMMVQQPMTVNPGTVTTVTTTAPVQQPQVMIGGQQGLLAPQQQTISFQTAPMMMPSQPMIVNSVIPNAPPTLVVDTSPQAMVQNGFDPAENVHPSGSQGRNRTQRAGRSGRGSPPPQGAPQQSSSSSNVRVTVQKLG